MLLIRTLKGDSDLDQEVDFADLVVLAQNYNEANKGWHGGDSDYSGIVDFADLVALAQNYNATLLSTGEIDQLAIAAGQDFVADWQLATALVPEPSAAAVVGLFAATAMRRGRNR